MVNVANKICGYLCVLIQITFQALGAACAQKLEGYIPIFELNAIRFTVQFVISILLGVSQRHIPRVSRCFVLPLFALCISLYALNIGKLNKSYL